VGPQPRVGWRYDLCINIGPGLGKSFFYSRHVLAKENKTN
jgi:hypothetical protein